MESSFASSTSDTSVFPSLKFYTESEALKTKKDFLVEERSKIHQKWASKKKWEEEALKGFLALEEEVSNIPPRPSPAPSKWPKLRTESYVDSDVDSASETTSTIDIDRLRRDHIRNVKALEAEKELFEKYKSEELAKLKRLHHETEVNKRREKLTLEKHQLVTATTANKKERQEIELLRETVKELNSKLKKKESKSSSELSRLKDRAVTLTRRNEELQQIINDLNAKLMDQRSKPKLDVTAQELEHTVALLTKQNSLLRKKLRQFTDESDTASGIENCVTESAQGHSSTPSPSRVVPDKNEGQNSPLDELGAELRLMKPFEEVCYPDGKCERMYANGTRLVLYRNGTTKEHRSSGYTKLRFVNGDAKETFEDGKVVYFYAETKTIHTSLPDKTEMFQFANGQLEKHHVDGTIEVKFPDATVQYIYPNNEEKSIFPDGTIQTVDIHGRKVIQFVDGTQKVYENGSSAHSTSKSTSPLEKSPRKVTVL
ncbi:hypothetical protein K493DRAFT_404217 [Basidiobolus meristosporus CBS 931.73]|uniref:Centromere protein J C-terminal domain-containing protein n=1 Tax=Basidiobolus meristosporus CBS 931.73 TaxID=1314790 RepID=A0A1Y1Z691_9FUNG|nr:hypothetical protein K493DRAFT_404217 [Basidiobolus meristosporus CBS 931.73]|eukprot:ORY05736.1 hypothetical protein K493DRAFT_404217 [Basidiobolus meristosporus CBS 931.73]